MSLIEVVIGVFLFVLVAVSVYRGFALVLTVIKNSEARTTAMLLANEQIEVIRNLAYKDVGIVQGIPAGLVPRNQILVRNGMTFNLLTTIRDIDDPFDGQMGSSTHNDTASADYRQVEIQIGCTNCKNYATTTILTTIAPKNLEGSTNNGGLFVRVFDSAGLPVVQASVHIGNGSTISIDETTDNNGLFQLVNIPPGSLAYQITATKAGFSTARTYTPHDPVVYNPLDPNLTITSGQVTQKSLAIDTLGEIHVRSVEASCSSTPNFSFHLRGDKYLGTTATGTKVYKVNQSAVTDNLGVKTLTGIEWDNYSVWGEDNSRELIGVMPATPFALTAGASQDVTLITTTTAKVPNSMLVAVKDKVTGLPVAGAVVAYKGKTLTTNLDSSLCAPSGQVFFNGLSTGTTTLSVSHSGYQTYNASVNTVTGWQSVVVPLTAQ